MKNEVSALSDAHACSGVFVSPLLKMWCGGRSGQQLFFLKYAKLAYHCIDRRNRMSTDRGTTHDTNADRREHGARSRETRDARPEQKIHHN